MLASLLREQDNARRIAAATRLQVPEPLGTGEPGEGYAGWWTAYRWIDGETASDGIIRDEVGFAEDLAQLVLGLHAMAVAGRSWDGRSRGGPLAAKAAWVRQSLAQSTGLTDVPAVTRIWERCLATGRGHGPDVWLHADLMPGNLLVREGRLVAVIDCESVCIGDPAVDLIPAWNLMTATARDAYRRALDVDDATWERGRGWAIVQAIGALPYYIESNPVMASTARRTLVAVQE
jgi:aminoglycoside phosphotransferase (APT) family kinase protein